MINIIIIFFQHASVIAASTSAATPSTCVRSWNTPRQTTMNSRCTSSTVASARRRLSSSRSTPPRATLVTIFLISYPRKVRKRFRNK